jgi:hypothetical protein
MKNFEEGINAEYEKESKRGQDKNIATSDLSCSVVIHE